MNCTRCNGLEEQIKEAGAIVTRCLTCGNRTYPEFSPVMPMPAGAKGRESHKKAGRMAAQAKKSKRSLTGRKG